MRLFLLALRNLGRNRRRTLIALGTVAFGSLAIVFLQGFVNGFVRMGIEASVLSRVGAIQIHRKGYFGADEPLKLNFHEDPKLVAMLSAVPGVTAVTPRITFDGLVSNGSDSAIFMATAIDPVREYEVCPLRRTNVARGSKPLGPGRDDLALIGQTLAESLGGKIGSTLVMQGASPNKGSTNALDVEVVGFLPTRTPVESKRMATVSLALAQDLLHMQGQITEYVVGVSDLARVDEVAERVRSAVPKDFEITTWHDVDPITRDRTNVLRWVLGFVALVLFLLVATGIVNTMLMSVYERVREIGTMLAVGVRRRQVMMLFLWEALGLGFLGSFVGVSLGVALIGWLGHRGITIRPPNSDASTMFPHVSATFLGLVVAFGLIGTIVSALYPSRKAAKLRPVEALRAT